MAIFHLFHDLEEKPEIFAGQERSYKQDELGRKFESMELAALKIYRDSRLDNGDFVGRLRESIEQVGARMLRYAAHYPGPTDGPFECEALNEGREPRVVAGMQEGDQVVHDDDGLLPTRRQGSVDEAGG